MTIDGFLTFIIKAATRLDKIAIGAVGGICLIIMGTFNIHVHYHGLDKVV